MAWAAILLDTRNRLGEPNAAYWTNKELQDWYNAGVAIQHRIIWKAVLDLEDRAFAEALENDYCRLFLVKSASANLVAGTQDYSVPTGFWRAVRVTIVVNGVECPADYVPFADDWDVRTLPHKGPTPTRPKYSLTPDGKIRLYVTPGDKTIPNSTNAFFVYFMKSPKRVDLEDTPPGVQDTEVTDPFNEAPKAWMCYHAMIKSYDAGDPYLGEFKAAIATIVTGPSKDAAEKKVVNVTKNYYGQPPAQGAA